MAMRPEPDDDIHDARRRAHWPKDYVETRERRRREAARLLWAEVVILVLLGFGLAFAAFFGVAS